MKKFILMMGLCIMTACFCTGCVDRAEMQGMGDSVDQEEQLVKTLDSTIEGFQLVEGNLEELDTKTVSMQTADGHALRFKLAPETLVYREQGKDLLPGDEITVVFEGSLHGTDTEGVSVIAVSLAQ